MGAAGSQGGVRPTHSANSAGRATSLMRNALITAFKLECGARVKVRLAKGSGTAAIGKPHRTAPAMRWNAWMWSESCPFSSGGAGVLADLLWASVVYPKLLRNRHARKTSLQECRPDSGPFPGAEFGPVSRRR